MQAGACPGSVGSLQQAILDAHSQKAVVLQPGGAGSGPSRMASFGPTELFVLNFVGIQEELGKLFGAHGSVLEYWVSQKKTGGATSNSGLYGVVRRARIRPASLPSRSRAALSVRPASL